MPYIFLYIFFTFLFFYQISYIWREKSHDLLLIIMVIVYLEKYQRRSRWGEGVHLVVRNVIVKKMSKTILVTTLWSAAFESILANGGLIKHYS